MMYNTTNYSLYSLSDCNEYPSIDDFIQHSGCQQLIRSITSEFLYIAIPQDLVNIVISHINTRSEIVITIDEILEEYKSFGFDFNYKLIESSYFVKFNGGAYKNFYIFQLPRLKNSKKRYYAFCTLRHFYYYENLAINYFSLYKHLNDEEDKIVLLGALAELFNVPHVFINSIQSGDISTSFSSLLDKYLKVDGNYNLNYRGIIPTKYSTSGNRNWIELEDFFKIKKDYLEYKEIFKDTINKSFFITPIFNNNTKILSDTPYNLFNRRSYYIDYIKINKGGQELKQKMYTFRKMSLIPYNILISKKHGFAINNYSKKIINLRLSKINKNKLYYSDSIIYNEDISKIKNRSLLYKILNNSFIENSFPIICKRESKLLRDEVSHIITSKEDFEAFKQNNKRKKFVYQNYYEGEKVIFHISKKTGVFHKNNLECFENLSFNFKTDILKEVYRVFETLNLDLGVVKVIINSEKKVFNIIEVDLEAIDSSNTFISYLRQINILCAD